MSEDSTLDQDQPRVPVNRFGQTPLFDAALKGDCAGIREHLDAGLIDINWGNLEGYTPLYIAAQHGHAEAVALLLERGADPNVVDCNGMGPLYVAAVEAGKANGAARFCPIVAELLAHDAEPDFANRWSVTPRSWAHSGELQRLFEAVPQQSGGSASKSRRAQPPPRKQRPEDRWKSEHSRLWDELVPPSGEASTVQGEIIRIVGKLTREAYTNGNGNWDAACELMWRYVGQTLDDPATFSADERANIRSWVDIIIRDCANPDVSGDGSVYYRVGEKAVAWVLAHPEPIARPESDEGSNAR